LPKLYFQGVTKIYGRRVVVDCACLAVAGGTIHALEGPNGSGKSTLFEIAAGFLKADKGIVVLERDDGRSLILDVRPPSGRAADGLAYVPQTPHFLAGLSTLDNLKLAAPKSVPAIFAGLESLRLTRLLDQRPCDMAGSDRVFLALALAYVQEPQFLIVDEPFPGLSAFDLVHCVAILRRFRERGTGILLTDHNAHAILEIADTISIIRDGSIVFSSSAQEARASAEATKLYFRVNA
jgi:ABC-type lipopolysaccharide export system ATPase subunit